MNYDHYVLGVGNSNHPANQEETELFQSEDLNECLSYAKCIGDFDALEFAIELQTERLRIAKKLIDELKKELSTEDQKNKLQRIKNYL